MPNIAGPDKFLAPPLKKLYHVFIHSKIYFTSFHEAFCIGTEKLLVNNIHVVLTLTELTLWRFNINQS